MTVAFENSERALQPVDGRAAVLSRSAFLACNGSSSDLVGNTGDFVGLEERRVSKKLALDMRFWADLPAREVPLLDQVSRFFANPASNSVDAARVG